MADKGKLVLLLRAGEGVQVGNAEIRYRRDEKNRIYVAIEAPRDIPISRLKREAGLVDED